MGVGVVGNKSGRDWTWQVMLRVGMGVGMGVTDNNKSGRGKQ